MEEIIHKSAEFFLSLGYIGIFIMMFLEASFIPFPSEVALLPAGYLVASGKMDPFLVLIAGTFGSMGGASLNYILGFTLGRELLIKYGKYLFMDKKKFHQMELLFRRKGDMIVFFGRFVPVIRQYISFPPGVVKMDFKKFLLFTGIASGIYVAFLVSVGYFYENHEKMINYYVTRFKYSVVAILVVYAIYKIRNYYKGKNKKS
ncbi:DedA family protein [Cetobacterium sp. 8H]|uniref:DedA family protein n=1 Tax=Cetobacterium sp. 8H TaxID=2759681 RepID=UPI00163B83A3|nr:DedA family protein [Cetobacterium sp. 8H]MBC2850845.1 DedA family protein [Cetobacterium sp. 8H]